MTAPAYYKWLRPDHSGAYGHGDYTAYLPHGKRPGKWLPLVKDPEPCQRGYHVVTVEYLPEHWVVPGVLYEAEARGATVAQEEKTACAQLRLTRRVGTLTRELAVAFAADCAEHVLPIFETAFPGDKRPRRAIEAARTGVAARDASRDAAEAAARAARAAGVAAGAAAWAARTATWAAWAAWAAEASRTAAGAAPKAGAWAAGNAAEAAGDAAEAAGNADAERTWQGTHLIELLERRP